MSVANSSQINLSMANEIDDMISIMKLILSNYSSGTGFYSKPAPGHFNYVDDLVGANSDRAKETILSTPILIEYQDTRVSFIIGRTVNDTPVSDELKAGKKRGLKHLGYYMPLIWFEDLFPGIENCNHRLSGPALFNVAEGLILFICKYNISEEPEFLISPVDEIIAELSPDVLETIQQTIARIIQFAEINKHIAIDTGWAENNVLPSDNYHKNKKPLEQIMLYGLAGNKLLSRQQLRTYYNIAE